MVGMERLLTVDDTTRASSCGRRWRRWSDPPGRGSGRSRAGRHRGAWPSWAGSGTPARAWTSSAWDSPDCGSSTFPSPSPSGKESGLNAAENQRQFSIGLNNGHRKRQRRIARQINTANARATGSPAPAAGSAAGRGASKRAGTPGMGEKPLTYGALLREGATSQDSLHLLTLLTQRGGKIPRISCEGDLGAPPLSEPAFTFHSRKCHSSEGDRWRYYAEMERRNADNGRISLFSKISLLKARYVRQLATSRKWRGKKWIQSRIP